MTSMTVAGTRRSPARPGHRPDRDHLSSLGLLGIGSAAASRLADVNSSVRASAGPGVAVAATATGPGGYWTALTDGTVVTSGAVPWDGDLHGEAVTGRIVGITPTPDGRGYWLVGADGGVFAFGDAGWFGSAGGLALDAPVVGMEPTPTGHGYWLVASDGGVFAFGDATFHGSMGGTPLDSPVGGDGRRAGWPGVLAGRLPTAACSPLAMPGFQGSLGGLALNEPVVGMAANPDGAGTGWWPRTAASSPWAVPRSPAPGQGTRRPRRRSPWCPRARGTGSSAAQGRPSPSLRPHHRRRGSSSTRS